MKLIGAVTTAAIVLCASGCGGSHERFCTLMGCSSGVSVDLKPLPKKLPTARKIDVCVAGQCSRNTVYEKGRPEGKFVPKPFGFAEGHAGKLHGQGPYVVTVTVRDRHGKILLSAQR